MSKKQNGSGTWYNTYEKAVKAGTPVDVGTQSLYEDNVKGTIIKALANSYLDGLSLLFGRWLGTNALINNCLRDDIWELEAIQEQVLNELFKAAILADYTNASILWSDYVLINNILRDGWGVDADKSGEIKTGEYYTLKKNYITGEIWFPSGKNFYVDCPYGDFTQAWKDLKNSFDQLIATFGKEGTLELGSFKSMTKIAKERAIKRAQKWIKENQITLTVGGKEGYSPRSLINGPGLQGLAGDVNTELGFVTDYGTMVYENTKKVFTSGKKSADIKQYVKAYEDAFKAKDVAVEEMERALVFNLSLNNVSEESLKGIDAIMFKINGTIQDAYTGTPQNVQKLCEKLNKLAKSQCKNKSGGDIPSCNL